MNAAEIRTRLADLEQASRDNLPGERFIDILKSLQKEVKITEKLLRVCVWGILSPITYLGGGLCGL